MQSRQISSLLKVAGEGAEGAYDEVIAIAAGRLEKLARRMLARYPSLRRWEQTDDVVQNAAIRLHRSLAKVRPDSMARFIGLASTEIRRTLIDLARHHFGPEGGAANHQTGAIVPGHAEGNGRRRAVAEPESLEDWTRFHEAIGQLPEDERQVFELVWFSGLEQSDISEITGLSIRTVKRRWRAARLNLYSMLGGVSPLSTKG